jgi:hypothetical protein
LNSIACALPNFVQTLFLPIPRSFSFQPSAASNPAVAQQQPAQAAAQSAASRAFGPVGPAACQPALLSPPPPLRPTGGPHLSSPSGRRVQAGLSRVRPRRRPSPPLSRLLGLARTPRPWPAYLRSPPPPEAPCHPNPSHPVHPRRRRNPSLCRRRCSPPSPPPRRRKANPELRLEARRTLVPLVFEPEPCVDRARSPELHHRLAASCAVAVASQQDALP